MQSLRNTAFPYTLGRGYCSLDPRRQMLERFKASGKKKLIVLVMSDFDPEGWNIPHTFVESLMFDFGIDKEHIQGVKVCLTSEQAKQRDLPNAQMAKKTSSRYREFAALFGDKAWEVEALPVAERARLLTLAIREWLGMDVYNAEVEAEKKDKERLEKIRQEATKAITRVLEEQEELERIVKLSQERRKQ